MKQDFLKMRGLWDYRHLTFKLAISEFRLRYKNSVLGFFWSLIEPLLMLIVLYIVFTNFMRVNIEHYQLFLLMGIISWNMLSRGTTMSLNSILGKSSLVKKAVSYTHLRAHETRHDLVCRLLL